MLDSAKSPPSNKVYPILDDSPVRTTTKQLTSSPLFKAKISLMDLFYGEVYDPTNKIKHN